MLCLFSYDIIVYWEEHFLWSYVLSICRYVIFATHVQKLTELSTMYPNVTTCHFAVDISRNRLDFKACCWMSVIPTSDLHVICQIYSTHWFCNLKTMIAVCNIIKLTNICAIEYWCHYRNELGWNKLLILTWSEKDAAVWAERRVFQHSTLWAASVWSCWPACIRCLQCSTNCQFRCCRGLVTDASKTGVGVSYTAEISQPIQGILGHVGNKWYKALYSNIAHLT